MFYLKQTIWALSLTALFLPGEVLRQDTLSTTEGVAAVPQRIVSLAPSVTETLFALGVGDRLVGVTTFCDYPPQAQRVPKIGSFVSPSVEAVLAKQPDLVVGVRETDQGKIKRMKRMGLRVLVISVTRLKDTFESIHSLAQIVGREKAGKELLSRLQGQIDRIRARIAGAQRRRVLMLVGLRPLVAVGKGTYIDELLTLAGGDNIADAAPQPWPHLPLEYVVAKAPHVIIDGGMGSERGAPGKNWADLGSVPAVKDGRIYSYASDKILRPGPRVGEALEEIARLIHPECFARDGKESGCEGP
jgi:iron complex transport system substrate-binding protein